MLISSPVLVSALRSEYLCVRMKLIDKYLLRTFIVPLIYCMIAFIMIYVIYDLFDNLNDFVEGKTPLPLVIRYYIVLMPSVMVRIVPISLLLAVLYSLASLTKNNELTAMRACGVSLLRLMMPFVAVGILASVIVAVVNETIGPRAAFWCVKFVKEQKHDDPNFVYIARQMAIKKESLHRIWLINEFDIRTFEMRGVELLQQRADSSDEAKIQAKNARWLDGRWWFSELTVQRYDVDGNPMGAPNFITSQEMTELSETPNDFLSEIKDPQYLSSRELLTYIDTHPQLQKDSIARLTVDLHHRLALPWTCLIVTLLGIPFGAQTGRKGANLGVALSIGLFFGYYSLIHVGISLGKNMIVQPWLGGWLPNIAFLIVGVVMVYRMR